MLHQVIICDIFLQINGMWKGFLWQRGRRESGLPGVIMALACTPSFELNPLKKGPHIISICEKSLKAQQWRRSTSRHLHVNKLCVCLGVGGGGCRGCVLLRDPVFAPKRVKDLPCKVCGLIVSTFNSTEKLPLDWIGNSMSPLSSCESHVDRPFHLWNLSWNAKVVSENCFLWRGDLVNTPNYINNWA